MRFSFPGNSLIRVGAVAVGTVIILVDACGKPPVQLAPPPAAAAAVYVALSGASVFIGAGDIATCGETGAARSAHIVDSVLRADSVAKVDDAVFSIGDNAYESGTGQEFIDCWGTTWGDPKKGIMRKIHPVPGNHEYLSPGADPYYAYFGKAAGTPGQGYYSYTLGQWHVQALNSEIFVNRGFSAKDRQDQLDWVAQDLKSSGKLCTVVYFHHPRFSTGWHGSDSRLQPLWQVLYDNNVDLVLNGHDHDYERFSAQTPAGFPDSTRGITQFVIGSGGTELREFKNTIERNSLTRISSRIGVLILTLGKNEYRSAFLDANGRIEDPSGGKCH